MMADHRMANKRLAPEIILRLECFVLSDTATVLKRIVSQMYSYEADVSPQVLEVVHVSIKDRLGT